VTSVSDTAAGLDADPPAGKRRIAWYDGDDAQELMASGAMTRPVLSPEVISVVMKGSKLNLGNASRVLCHDPESDGPSIVHAWFGENFPLPRHTHSGDCTYFVLKGELRMGAKTVRAGSGFFVPSGRPYTYRAGVGGVEVLEFRDVSSFDIGVLDQDAAKWESFVAVAEEMADTWVQTRPEWVRNLDASTTAVEPE
jgi:mannose-6-phosphate isomerase-like protein (cupin superfamily)